MSAKFKVLAGFLDRYSEEVEGRAVLEPPEELKSRLLQLVRGSLPAAEQAGVFEFLSQNPEWISWLAREVKALRPAAKGS